MKDQYIKDEIVRVLGRFQRPKHTPGFTSRQHLSAWFGEQLIRQDCKCFYCETSILDIKELINAGLLSTRAVRGEGARGHVLEIDKKINHLGYSPENCVLACYYCNNDKSYTMRADEYKKFYGPGRNTHFKFLKDSL